MPKDNHEAAQSAIYHIDTMVRKLTLLKQYINTATGTINDPQVVIGLANGVDEEITELHIDVTRLL